MSPFWIIEGLDVFEDATGRRFVGWEYLIAEPFAFQATEEAFHGRVVPAVSFAAHTAFHFEEIEYFSVSLGGILGASVGVVQQSFFGLSFFDGLM